MEPLKNALVKRRGANFTMEECNLLVNLIVAHSAELDSGRDATSWELKRAAWMKITNRYNARCRQQRPLSVLRKKYENMRKELKNKLSERATELVMMEDDQVEAGALPLLPHEKKLVKLLRVTRDQVCGWLGQDKSTKSMFYGEHDMNAENNMNAEHDVNAELDLNASHEYTDRSTPHDRLDPDTKFPTSPPADSPSENLMMAVLNSLSDAEDSDMDISNMANMTKEEKIPSSRSGRRQRDPRIINLRLGGRVLRQKAELLKLQIDNQKTEMQRSSQVHTYTLKTMEAELRIKHLQEQLLLKQLGESKVNGT